VPDAAHPSAAVGTGGKRIVRRVRRGVVVRRRTHALAGLLAGLAVKQIPDTPEIETAFALVEETVVTDTMEAVRQGAEAYDWAGRKDSASNNGYSV
jgi:hypothetical protein